MEQVMQKVQELHGMLQKRVSDYEGMMNKAQAFANATAEKAKGIEARNNDLTAREMKLGNLEELARSRDRIDAEKKQLEAVRDSINKDLAALARAKTEHDNKVAYDTKEIEAERVALAKKEAQMKKDYDAKVKAFMDGLNTMK